MRLGKSNKGQRNVLLSGLCFLSLYRYVPFFKFPVSFFLKNNVYFYYLNYSFIIHNWNFYNSLRLQIENIFTHSQFFSCPGLLSGLACTHSRFEIRFFLFFYSSLILWNFSFLNSFNIALLILIWFILIFDAFFNMRDELIQFFLLMSYLQAALAAQFLLENSPYQVGRYLYFRNSYCYFIYSIYIS